MLRVAFLPEARGVYSCHFRKNGLRFVSFSVEQYSSNFNKLIQIYRIFFVMCATILKQLQAKHPKITYRKFALVREADSLTLSFDFSLSPDLHFSPTITIPTSTLQKFDPITERLAFLIGMVELISYWKLACPPRIEIECGHLTHEEIEWWKDLYRKGLGEFFYVNEINPLLEFDFFVRPDLTASPIDYRKERSEGVLILVGGGKDSIVTLEAAKSWVDRPKAALCVNPIKASLDAIKQSGLGQPLTVQRFLDPQLKTLNQIGYLNGHTPFSALLAFISLLVAHQNGFKYVLASNETSASEGNAFIDDVEVNHQYSKSLHFEKRFREYPFGFPAPAEYLSFLRPLNELQICAIFALHKEHLPLFRSCNREQTQVARAKESPEETTPGAPRSGWCGSCPKCIFTAICLGCFLSMKEMREIFGNSPFESPNFSATARELAGFSEHKPFECVGTFEEVRSALVYLGTKAENFEPGSVLFGCPNDEVKGEVPSLKSLLTRWDEKNYLTSWMEESLLSRLQSAVAGFLP